MYYRHKLLKTPQLQREKEMIHLALVQTRLFLDKIAPVKGVKRIVSPDIIGDYALALHDCRLRFIPSPETAESDEYRRYVYNIGIMMTNLIELSTQMLKHTMDVNSPDWSEQEKQQVKDMHTRQFFADKMMKVLIEMREHLLDDYR